MNVNEACMYVMRKSSRFHSLDVITPTDTTLEIYEQRLSLSGGDNPRVLLSNVKAARINFPLKEASKKARSN